MVWLIADYNVWYDSKARLKSIVCLHPTLSDPWLVTEFLNNGVGFTCNISNCSYCRNDHFTPILDIYCAAYIQSSSSIGLYRPWHFDYGIHQNKWLKWSKGLFFLESLLVEEQFDILHMKIGVNLISTPYLKVIWPLYIVFNNSVTNDRILGKLYTFFESLWPEEHVCMLFCIIQVIWILYLVYNGHFF